MKLRVSRSGVVLICETDSEKALISVWIDAPCKPNHDYDIDVGILTIDYMTNIEEKNT